MRNHAVKKKVEITFDAMPQRSNIYSFNLKHLFRKLVSILFWCTKNNTHLWGIGMSVVFLLLFKKIQN